MACGFSLGSYSTDTEIVLAKCTKMFFHLVEFFVESVEYVLWHSTVNIARRMQQATTMLTCNGIIQHNMWKVAFNIFC